MLMLEIMKEYHWDYYTYTNQPVWLIAMIVEKMKIDAKKKSSEEKMNKKH